jgi:precorrin-6B methylase 2
MIQTLEKEKQRVGPEPIHQLAMGFAGTKVLLVANQLGVFEVLQEGGQTAAGVSYRLSLPEHTLEMLLDACVSLKLLEKTGFIYSNSALAEAYLIPGRRGYLGRFLDHFNDHMYPAWLYLEDAVRSGHAQIQRVVGDRDDHFFQAIDHKAKDLEIFMQTMEEHSLLEGKALAEVYDFSPHRLLLDVAGGTGAMSVAILEKHPFLRSVVFDRPPVCEIAKQNIQRHGFSSRIDVVPGDVFKDPLPRGADILLLSGVLHNWDDEHAKTILRQCATALPSGGILLINEQLLNEEKTEPLPAALCSLNMLIMMEGAAEHSQSEYESLLRSRGFRLEEVLNTGSVRQLLVARHL